MLKSAVKSLLPQKALNAARLIRDVQSLALTPDCRFDVRNLKAANDLALDAIWSDEKILSAWQNDYALITTILSPEDLDRGVNPGDRRALYYLVKALQPSRFLEVGTHIGASTLFIARALKSNGSGHVTTVDIYDVNAPANGLWKQCGASACPRDMLARAECDRLVSFSAAGALNHMKQTDETYDFIFLDGDHSAPAVYKEVSAALQILAPGGVILLHDVFPNGKALYPDNNIIHGPWQAAARMQKEVPGLKILPLGNLPWPTKQGVNTTSLALAVRA